MSSTDLTPFTNRLAVSSAGASRIGSTMPFSPEGFLHFETRRGKLHGRHLFLPTPVSRMEGPRFVVGFHILGSTGELEWSEADVQRLICHALIQHLSDAT